MPWFKVDDTFHSHPKVLAASPAALGLWVVAGSWSGANLSDGFIPDHVLPRLLPDSATLAQQLVAAGLWKRGRGGYRFHDWNDFNPDSKSVLSEREAARERMRTVRAKRKQAATSGQRTETSDQRGHFEQSLNEGREIDEEASSGHGTPGQDGNGSPEQNANVRELFGNPDPTRPDPFLGGALSGSPTTAHTQPSGAPDPRCPKHLEHPTDGPCGACGDARRARTRWDMADSERRRNSPKCRDHRGQPADNCALCRSEALAAEEAS
jgi:hypothetical protein